MIGRTVSHYHIVEQLGGGGMGVVYRAEDVRLGRFVALKFLPERLTHDSRHLERFKLEARVASALNHPNICAIHDVGEFEGQPYLVMEFLQGATLKHRRDEGRVALGDAVSWALEVARGLEAAHGKGIIHRDLKPANIFLTDEGRIKILDFGLAKLTHTDVRDAGQPTDPTLGAHLTDSGILMGTVAYMSPEQVRGDPIDARSDLFSLGVLLYELCTGQAPFAGPTPGVVVSRVLAHDPPPPTSLNSHLPEELERVILKLLEKDRAERYQSASELCADLEAVRPHFDPTGDSISPPLARTRPRTFPSRLGSFLWLAVPVLLLVLIGFLLTGRVDWNPIPDQKHLVVLPFTCIGERENREGFCDGLVEVLTSRLTRLEQPAGSLLVVPATEVVSGGVTNAAQAGRLFGVNLAVSGTVWSRPEGVQVAMNLIDVGRGRQIRSAEILSGWEETSALVEWAFREVAAMIRLGVSPDILNVLAAGSSGVPQAEDFYIQGRGYLSRRDRPGNIDLAITLFDKALVLDPTFARGHAAVGEAYWERYGSTLEARWIENAIVSSRRALELEPGLSEARVTLGRVYRGTGRYEEAVRELQDVLTSHPSNADALRELARAYEALGDLETAERTYRRAIEERTGDWRSYQELGYFYLIQGRTEEAVGAFEHVLDLTPDNPVGHSDLGVGYVSLGRTDEAERAFLASINAGGTYHAFTNLGTIYFDRRDYQGAVELYRRAAELNERSHEVWGNLASALRFMPGGEREAREAYARAAKLTEERRRINPRDASVAANLAVYYAALGREEECGVLLEEIADAAPQTQNVLLGVVDAYERLGDREQGLFWLRRAMEQGYRMERIETSPAFESLRSDERYQRMKAEFEGQREEVQP
jgi:serine/threonine protein kinase/tetratricopeptide (TPR) repeat protein/TolB-like protein